MKRISRALCALTLSVGSLAGFSAGCSSARSHGPVRGVFNEDAYDAEGYAGGYAEEAPMASAPEADDSGGAFPFQSTTASGAARAGRPMAAKSAPPPPPKPPADAPASAPSEPSPEASRGAEPSVPVPGARLMIYTGSATLMVPSVQEAQQKLTARVEALGGYVQSATGNTSANNATITYRVPVERFFEVKNELATYGQVLHDTVQAEDVTKQVFDLEIRLDNATKSRDRLVELLKQAQKMEDILQIEAEIRRLTDEIEGLKGQLRFLKDRVSFSTLTVSLYSNAPPPVTGPRRTSSRFDWINQVGPERVLNDF